MPSLLPNQIPSESVDVITQNDPKKMAHNWWLFFYNLSQQVLGSGSGTTAAYQAQVIADLDADIDSTDAIGLVRRVANLEKQVYEPLPDQIDTRALLLAQDAILPDPTPRAQPVTVVAVSGGTFTYTALADGTVIVNAGTVSAISVSRDGGSTFYPTSVGSIPVSRLDQVKMTYTGSPTMTFFPR